MRRCTASVAAVTCPPQAGDGRDPSTAAAPARVGAARRVTLRRVVASLVPIATRQQLAARGVGRAELERGLTAGRFVRIRPGYYAAPDAPAALAAAVRAGGVATSLTALRHYGVWVPPDETLHVAVGSSAHPPAPPHGVVLHWTSDARGSGVRFAPIAPLLVALQHALTHLPPEHVVAVLDSVLHQRLLSPVIVDELIAGAPRRIRRAVTGALDSKAESGLESIVRYLLRSAGISCVSQVRIPGIGEVHLLVDGWLIIEADGADHATVQQMRKDRSRDAAAIALGMRSLRFGGDIVLHDHARLLATVRQVLAEGRPHVRAW